MKTLSLLVILAFFVAAGLACSRKEKPQVPTAAVSAKPEQTVVVKGGRKTLFERNEKRRECITNPAVCDGDFFEMDIKKSLEKEIDPGSSLSTQFCVGGCSDSSVLQWSLEWQ